MGILGIILRNLKNMKRAKKIRAMDKTVILAMDDESFYDTILCVCNDAVYEINAPELTEEQKLAYSLMTFEAEVNNGGLCQFFVNSSRECAPYISKALDVVGAAELKVLFDDFVDENGIDTKDLSSFKIEDIDEYEAQTKRFDFDSFDDRFYEDTQLHKQIIDYARKHIERIVL